jgi:hypothetical protein
MTTGTWFLIPTTATTLKTAISEMISRNSVCINGPHNTEMHRDVWIIVVILCQFRIISVIKGFSLLLLLAPPPSCSSLSSLSTSFLLPPSFPCAPSRPFAPSFPCAASRPFAPSFPCFAAFPFAPLESSSTPSSSCGVNYYVAVPNRFNRWK